jgi:hypothetical protein
MHYIVTLSSFVCLDDLLPLFFELKKIGKLSKVLFIARNRQLFEYIEKNKVLYDGIDSINGRVEYFSNHKNKFVRLLLDAYLLKDLLFNKIIYFDTYYYRLASIISNFNCKVWGGRKIKCIILPWPYRYAINTVKFLKANTKQDKKNIIIKDYDSILLSQPKEQFERISNVNLVTNCRITQLGYTRGLREWRNFLERNIDRYLDKEIERPFIFFPLGFIHRDHKQQMKGLDSMSICELLKECLLVLRDFNDDIVTVFKPHSKTDVGTVQDILEDVGFDNYIFSYVHPVVLAKRAKFMLTTFSSTLLLQAYYERCMTVEYAHYYSKFFELNNGQSRYLDAVDYFIHRDREKLRQVLKKAIYSNIEIKRSSEVLETVFPVLSSKEIEEKFKWL